jgi:hypothetical protein
MNNRSNSKIAMPVWKNSIFAASRNQFDNMLFTLSEETFS